jgi:hypothetical protein
MTLASASLLRLSHELVLASGLGLDGQKPCHLRKADAIVKSRAACANQVVLVWRQPCFAVPLIPALGSDADWAVDAGEAVALCAVVNTAAAEFGIAFDRKEVLRNSSGATHQALTENRARRCYSDLWESNRADWPGSIRCAIAFVPRAC